MRIHDVKRGITTTFALLAMYALYQKDALVLDNWNAPVCAATAYFYVDMFYCNHAFMLHHACVIALLIMAYKVERNPPLLLCLLNQEVSTLVLNVVYYAPARHAYRSQLLFAVVFAKIRLYDFYQAIRTPATFEASARFRTYVKGVTCLLYLVNLYWGILIVKKIMATNKNR